MKKKQPLAQLSPIWVGNPCWNAGIHKNYAGATQAAAPQYLWLDWLDMDGALSYRVSWAYSPKLFGHAKVNYQPLLNMVLSEYHSGDRRFLTGPQRRFTHPGYYRFKVMGGSVTGQTSRKSEYCGLMLK